MSRKYAVVLWDEGVSRIHHDTEASCEFLAQLARHNGLIAYVYSMGALTDEH